MTASNLGHELLQIAAARMKPMVRGAANVIGQLSGGETVDATVIAEHQRAIDRYGPAIIRGWREWFNEHTEEEQLQALNQLAQIDIPTVQGLGTATFSEVADSSSDDRRVSTTYLEAIPGSVEDSLTRESGSGRFAVPHAQLTGTRMLHRLLPTSIPPFPVGHQLADTPYELVELLGTGGFGAVYRARNRFEQHAPPRALKFCLNRTLAATLERERQLLDRLMQASLDADWSSRIVRLYGHNLDYPTPFLVYEFVAGGTLPQFVDVHRQTVSGGLPPDHARRIIVQVAEGLAFAHELGLVHRDIKPANILIENGQIKLADFGIGGVVSGRAMMVSQIGVSAVDQLSAGDRASLFRGSGTPLYMSAEQKRGDAPHPRQDIFSLGVMWYQLLVGDISRELQPGWSDELVEEYTVPVDDVRLIEKCVAYEKNRPHDGAALLDLLNDSPADVSAQPGVTGTVAAPVDDSRLLDALFEEDEPDADEFAAGPPIEAAAGQPLRSPSWTLYQKPGISSLCLCRDPRVLVTGWQDGSVRLWDLVDGCSRSDFHDHSAAVVAAASGDGSGSLYTAAADGEILHRRSAAPQDVVRCLIPLRDRPTSLALSANGRYLFIGTSEGKLHVWDTVAESSVVTRNSPEGSVDSLIISADGRALVSVNGGSSLTVWKLKNVRPVQTVPVQAGTLLGLVATASGNLIGWTDRGILRRWSLNSGAAATDLKAAFPEPVVSVAAEGDSVLATEAAGTLSVRPVHGGEPVARLKLQTRSPLVKSVLTSRYSRVVTAQADGLVSAWSLKSDS